jgi:hypothetical protein
MEERMSWRDAFGTAWGNLTGVNNEGGSVRTVRMLFFVVFVLGTAWAVYNYIHAQELLEEKEYSPSDPSVSSTVDTDRKRLASMVNQVGVTSEIRRNSPEIARTMLSLNKYPFGDPLMVDKPPEPDEKPFEFPLQPSIPEIIIDYPPEVILRAIMTLGTRHVALMDIPGVGNGMVVKVGDTFMQKKGRIVRIAPDKVTMSWGGKTWDMRP